MPMRHARQPIGYGAATLVMDDGMFGTEHAIQLSSAIQSGYHTRLWDCPPKSVATPLASVPSTGKARYGFLRQAAGGWLLNPWKGLELNAKLQSLQIEFPLKEIYSGIDFSASGKTTAQPD
jgi:hypothetical protein